MFRFVLKLFKYEKEHFRIAFTYECVIRSMW